MVELSDAGWYICVANNSFGRAQTQAYLTVNNVNPKSTPHKPTLGEWLKKVFLIVNSLNPFTHNILKKILLTVCYTFIIKFVIRIWCWIKW